MTVTRERLEELAALCAAGAATESEQAEMDALAREDGAAAALLGEYEAGAALLALSLPEVAPPANALAGIVATLDAGRSTAEPTTSKAAPPGAGADIISLAARRRAKFATAVAGVAFAAAAAFALLWFQERGAAGELRARAEGAEAQADKIREAANDEIDVLARKLSERDTEIKVMSARFEPLRSPSITLTSFADQKGATAKVFVDPEGRRWLVMAHRLPELGADKDYQLWFVPKDGKPVSGGLLEPGEGGVFTANPTLPADLADVKPAISREPKGGSPQPTDVLMMGDLI